MNINLKNQSTVWDVFNIIPVNPQDEKSVAKLYREASPKARKALGIKRFTSEQKQEVTKQLVEMALHHKAVRERRNCRSPLSRKDLIDRAIASHKRRFNEIKARDHSLVLNVFEENYKMPSGKWAGGDCEIMILKSKNPGADIGTVKAWSGNGKWSGNNLKGSINISRNWYKDCYLSGIYNAGGMLTTHAIQLEPNLWSASWIEQSRGLSVKVCQGYILISNDEYFHGKSIKTCQDLAKKHGVSQKVDQVFKSLNLEELIELYGDLTLTRRLSKLAGNCKSGTESWLNRHGFENRKSISIQEAFEADPGNNRVIASIKLAIRVAN